MTDEELQEAKEYCEMVVNLRDVVMVDYSIALDLAKHCLNSIAEVEQLQTILKAVEWVPIVGLGPGALQCPWCHWILPNGHAPDCPRQRALSLQV